MQKIAPFLSFDTEAEEAARFYVSIFENSKITGMSHYTEGLPGPLGTVMTVSFEIAGQEFTALNGGPFGFSPATSFVVKCRSQAEIDTYWEKLTADGGEEVQCGWLKDKYGVSWQIVPEDIIEWISDKDPARSQRVMQTMLPMIKLDFEALKQAYQGK